jgi:predicted RNA-binding protein with TRAM domain
MKAKGGSAVSAVEPTKPEGTFAADDAKPGNVVKVKAKQIETKTGKYGATKAKAYKPGNSSGPESKSAASLNQKIDVANDDKTHEKTDWIEIELVAEDDNPIAGEKYEVTVPDGSVASGTLDGDGFARIEGFETGQCKVSFPYLDTAAWDKVV